MPLTIFQCLFFLALGSLPLSPPCKSFQSPHPEGLTRLVWVGLPNELQRTPVVCPDGSVALTPDPVSGIALPLRLPSFLLVSDACVLPVCDVLAQLHFA